MHIEEDLHHDFEILDTIKKVKANPLLFDKILEKATLPEEEAKIVPLRKYTWVSWAAVLVLLIFNSITIVNYLGSDVVTIDTEISADQNDFFAGTEINNLYNYLENQ